MGHIPTDYNDREKEMDDVDKDRATSLYEHKECSKEGQKSGISNLQSINSYFQVKGYCSR